VLGMKKVIIEALKNYKGKIMLMLILLAFDIYLLTCPAKIIGVIIDNLYDIEANKQVIINNIYFLLGICAVYLVTRIVWKYFEVYISRGFEKDIKNKLFERFLKLKVKEIQNIKNGEIGGSFNKAYCYFSNGKRG